MAVITPDSYVKLLRIELTPDNQLTFSDINAQTNYFENLPRFRIRRFYLSKKRFYNSYSSSL